MTLIVDKKYLNKNKIAPTVKHESLKVCLKYVSQGGLLLWKGSDFNFNKFYLIPSKLQSIFHIKDEGLSSSSVFQNLLCNFIYSASLNLVSVELPLKSLATSRNNVSIPFTTRLTHFSFTKGWTGPYRACFKTFPGRLSNLRCWWKGYSV